MKTALLIAFAAMSLLLPLSILSSSSGAGDGVAVVFAPWVGEAQAMRRVAENGGALVRTGAFSFIAIAVPAQPNFASRIRSAGAWLLLDPRFVGGCFESTATQDIRT